jgi:hypothetical protein
LYFLLFAFPVKKASGMKNFKKISRVILVLQILAAVALAAMLFKGMGLLMTLSK